MRGKKNIILGDFVETKFYKHIGRVIGKDCIYNGNGKRDGWIDIQKCPVTDKQLKNEWIHILCHGGGVVQIPISRCKKVKPFELINNYNEFYFGKK
jgi:hypothetical protein